ncbi:hypothetical protein TEA_003434 [Camellia sinensis var. sinensis]|uniref:Uncharacterized protein n=1 Tax=Camellia sinensis var. sinensis TaxID=542762 RepID=A0A4S4DLW0_CAMSN|nr:hypothetical protein TEA_003434 [Camellia sinensis var. sinensis]
MVDEGKFMCSRCGTEKEKLQAILADKLKRSVKDYGLRFNTLGGGDLQIFNGDRLLFDGQDPRIFGPVDKSYGDQHAQPRMVKPLIPTQGVLHPKFPMSSWSPIGQTRTQLRSEQRKYHPRDGLVMAKDDKQFNAQRISVAHTSTRRSQMKLCVCRSSARMSHVFHLSRLSFAVVEHTTGAPIAGSAVDQLEEVVGYVSLGYPFGLTASILFGRHHKAILQSPKPKLFVMGTRDGFTSVKQLENKLKSAAGRVETHLLEGVGHFQMEGPAYDTQMVDLIIGFIRSLQIQPAETGSLKSTS